MINSINISMNLMRQHSRITVLVLLVSAFGPYIPNAHGVRVEHIVIYSFAGFYLIGWVTGKIKWNLNYIQNIIILLLTIALSTWLVTFVNRRPYDSYEIVAGLENYLQPVAILFILNFVVRGNIVETRIMLYLAAMMTLIFLILNSLLSLTTIFYDTWPFVKYFVGEPSGTDGLTVWNRSLLDGRYSGIFNQPFECGLAYSIGLLLWIHLINVKHVIFVDALIFIGLFLGGVFSVSKVFLFGGVPLAIIYGLWTKKFKILNLIKIITIIFIASKILAFIAPHWLGFTRLTNFFSSSSVQNHGGFINYYTATRFNNEKSIVYDSFNVTLQKAPIQGFGFGANSDFPLDSAYSEFFYQGGFIALTLYFIILAYIASVSYRGLKNGIQESKMIITLLILIVGAGLGAPVITINRVSIILWIILTICMNICCTELNCYYQIKQIRY